MSAVYPKSKELLLEYFLAGTTPSSVTFCAIGVNNTYTYNASHQTLVSVPGGSITAPEAELESVSILTGGILDADDVLFGDLDNGDEIVATIIYAKWGGGNLLFAYIDESTDDSLPQTVTGNQAQINWNTSGIFKL